MDNRITKRQLNELVSWTVRERLRCSWYRLLMTMNEMNYASWCLVGGFAAVPAAEFGLDEARGQG